MLQPTAFLTIVVGLVIQITAIADEPQAEGWKMISATKKGAWDVCRFVGTGEVQIDGGLIRMKAGEPLTGVRLKSAFPTDNFELKLDARRTSGADFFCGLTFPVGKGNCSLILGGWGGGLTGLSSIDSMDASENETSDYREFEKGKWYSVRLQVQQDRIKAWLDGKPLIDCPRGTRKFSVRLEMDPTLPVGIACYGCDSEIRGVQWRSLFIPAADSATTDAKPQD